MTTNRFGDGYDDLFDESMYGGFEVTPMPGDPSESGMGQPTMALPIDVIEMPEAILIMVDLPGIRASDLKLGVHGRALHLRAERNLEMPEIARAALRERGMGRVERVIPLPEGINPAGMKAKLSTGVLAIMLPRERAADADPSRGRFGGDAQEPDGPEPTSDRRSSGPHGSGSAPWMS
ncbi:MAG: Hsp20/alpha crystallin family protein [Phycisphaerales bacterium]